MAKSDQYEFRKFDLNSIACGSLVVNVGKRGSGKSYLTKNILYHFRKRIPHVVVFSSSEDCNGFYSDFVPPAFIHTELDLNVLQSIFDAQSKVIADNRAYCKKKKVKYKEHTFQDNLLIIIDDFMHDSKKFTSTIMKNIAFNGRHCNITFLFNIQYVMLLPPQYRSQTDICFMYKEVINANKKRLYDYYAGMFGSLSEFLSVFSNLTNNYEVMVIKMTNLDSECASGGIENMVFWYKADKVPEFKIGSRHFWKYYKKICGPKRTVKREPDKVSGTIKTIKVTN